MLDLIPAEHRDRAQAALKGAFGSAAVTAIAPVTGGASGALTYRLESGGRAYLLRLEGPRTPLRNPHHYACMQIAAQAGVAPPLLYADDAAGVAVMDFLTERPIASFPGGPAALAKALGELTARVQAAPAFPTLMAYDAVIGRMLGYLQAGTMFAPGLLDRHVAAFNDIATSYPWDAASNVSSHNDPNPRNLIFDGTRLWLIDWETSYRNDRFVDLAILADNFAAAPELEDVLLTAWLGRGPDRMTRARLAVMRPLTRLYYATIIFTLFSGAPRETPDADLTAMTPQSFGAAIATGKLAPAGPQTLYALAKMCLAGFLDGAQGPAFEDAIAIVRQG